MAIHATAVIDPQAEIDSSVEIGPHCVVEGEVRLSAGCRLIHNVFVTGWTELGEDCVLHPGSVVGHEPQDVKYKGERSYCRIGKNTILREHVTVHRGTVPDSTTVVGDDCFLLAGAHVAHNCALGNRVTLVNNVLLAGYVTIGNDAILSGGAAVHQFVRIGDLAMIAGHARVSMDIVPYAFVNLEGWVVGLNRVGLARAGFDHGTVQAVREAYRTLFSSGLSQGAAIESLRSTDPSKEIQVLIGFLEGASKRGIAVTARSGRKLSESPKTDA